MKNLAASLAFLMFSFPAMAAEEQYTLDPAHTNILWSAGHFGFSHMYGKFATVAGTLTLDEAKPENSKVSVTVTMNSIITGNPKLDEHLKAEAFFDVAKYATATFESTKVEIGEGGKTARVTGNLTLHGVTKPTVLNVTLNKTGEHPMTKKKTVGFSATTVIKRSDFGVSYGLPAVSDEIPVIIETEASVS